MVLEHGMGFGPGPLLGAAGALVPFVPPIGVYQSQRNTYTQVTMKPSWLRPAKIINRRAPPHIVRGFHGAVGDPTT